MPKLAQENLPSTFRLVLSDQARSATQEMMTKSGHRASDLIRIGLAFAKLALEEKEKGHGIAVLDHTGRILYAVEVPTPGSLGTVDPLAAPTTPTQAE